MDGFFFSLLLSTCFLRRLASFLCRARVTFFGALGKRVICEDNFWGGVWNCKAFGREGLHDVAGDHNFRFFSPSFSFTLPLFLVGWEGVVDES